MEEGRHFLPTLGQARLKLVLKVNLLLAAMSQEEGFGDYQLPLIFYLSIPSN